MKKKYYLIGFVAFVAIVIAYHFYAASQAEHQIDKILREQTNTQSSVSVQYSAVDVSPFTGKVSLSDLTVVFGDHIERAQHLLLDISYRDFLNIYFGGIPYGLEQLKRAKMTLISPSYTNSSGLQELKADTLDIIYTGNALDGIQGAINGTPFSKPHSIEAQSAGFTISLPQTVFSTVKAKQFRYSGSISAGKKSFWKNGTHQFAMESLVWRPLDSFQETYSFFIRGFGYPTSAIPFQSAHLHSTATSQAGVLKVESSVKSELALFSSSGLIHLNNPVRHSELNKMKIKITEFSQSFSRILKNIERLFSVALPRTKEGIVLQVEGTLSAPRISNGK